MSNVGVVWGGGGSWREISGDRVALFFRKTILFHLMFSSCFFMLDLFPTFIFGNIEKCPFTYWLNGRWFLQIVDLGNLNMKLNGRWFPQIVDGDSGNLYS